MAKSKMGDPGNPHRPAQNNASSGKILKGPNAFDAPTGKEVPRLPGKTESAPANTIGSDVQSVQGNAGSWINDQIGMRPGMQKSATAGSGLIGGGSAPDGGHDSSNLPGRTGGLPDGSFGAGNGRQPAQAGSTIGQTVAAPRTPFNPDLMGSEPPKPGRGGF